MVVHLPFERIVKILNGYKDGDCVALCSVGYNKDKRCMSITNFEATLHVHGKHKFSLTWDNDFLGFYKLNVCDMERVLVDEGTKTEQIIGFETDKPRLMMMFKEHVQNEANTLNERLMARRKELNDILTGEVQEERAKPVVKERYRFL